MRKCIRSNRASITEGWLNSECMYLQFLRRQVALFIAERFVLAFILVLASILRTCITPEAGIINHLWLRPQKISDSSTCYPGFFDVL